MADWYQYRGVINTVLAICCCFCNGAGPANDSDLVYKTQKWTQRISGELLSATLECDVCTVQCSWRYDQKTISNSSEVTLYVDRNDYGEYICYQASKVVMKVLVIPGNDNFTCSKCLISSVCDDGEEVIIISFSIHIDTHFITLPECEVLRDGLNPVCIIESGSCSRVFTSSNRSADYTVQCPIVDTSYVIRSGKINLNNDLEPCMTESSTSHHSMVTPATVSLPGKSASSNGDAPKVTSTTVFVPSQTTVDLEVVPSNITIKENAPFSAGAIAGAVLGVVLLLLSVLFGVIVCYHFRRTPDHRGSLLGETTESHIHNDSPSSDGDTFSGVATPLSNELPDLPYSGCQNAHLCSSEELMDAIRKAHVEINRCLKFSTLLQYLNRYAVFTRDEIERFHKGPHEERVNNLIMWLEAKSDDGIFNFVKALNDEKEHSGHKQILQTIKVIVCDDNIFMCD